MPAVVLTCARTSNPERIYPELKRTLSFVVMLILGAMLAACEDNPTPTAVPAAPTATASPQAIVALPSETPVPTVAAADTIAAATPTTAQPVATPALTTPTNIA